MNILRQWRLSESLVIAEVDEFPDETYRAQVREHILAEYPMLPWRKHLDESASSKLERLKKNLQDQYELRLAVLRKNELVGWSYGRQDSIDQASFFMGASMVIPELRRQGVYTSLVKKVLEITQERGFQSVWSMHVVTNNPVLIAKMKLGFHISGIETNAIYGSLVRLIYHQSDLRRKAAKFRAGGIRDAQIHEILIRG